MKKSLFLALALLCLAAPVAEARPGALDRSFGHGGKRAMALDLKRTWRSAATAVDRQPGGGSVALVGDTLIALDGDGNLKRRGLIHLSPPPFASQTLVDMATDRAGRIVVVGTVNIPADPIRQGVQSDESLFVARFTPWGYPDRTFGKNGVLVTDLDLEPPSFEPPPGQPVEAPAMTRGAGVAVDARGRLVLSGVKLNRIGPCQLGNHTMDHHFYKQGFVARLREDGSLDQTFGDGGLAHIPETHLVQAPLLTKQGSAIFVRTPEHECWNPVRQLARVTPQGALDRDFSEGWEFFETSKSSVALDRRGGVVVLWEGEETVQRGEGRDTMDGVDVGFVSRIQFNGKADRSFGRKGIATVMLGRREYHPSQVLVDGRDRILVAGAAAPKDALDMPGSFLLTRLDPEGKVDPRFGREGWAETRWGPGAEVKRMSAAFIGRGRVLVAGIMLNPALKHDAGVGFARFLTR
jgi:uncharacterized delta-60 repeat protein